MKLTIKQTLCLDTLEDKITQEIIFGGGAGSAKSVIGCYWLLKNCLKYPETRWLMGRSKLKTLKETTLNSFLWVCKEQGIVNGTHFTINHQSNIIKFFNGSEILMKDLFFYPSDPNFDELGSLEISGAFIDECNQIVKLAWDIVKSRIRYKLDEYGLIPKILGTCNPSKNWVYKDFYKPKNKETLEATKCFIQALVTDNPFISIHYINNLKGLPKPQRDRLLHGIWESDDDPDKLAEFDNILAIFNNEHVVDPNDKYYITCDVARMGSDKAVILLWRGMEIVKIVEFAQCTITELATVITNLKEQHNVSNNNIIADEDGVGGGLVDMLHIKGFVNNSSALNGANYANLKSQGYYTLAEHIEKHSIYISAEVTSTQEEEIIEELEQIKSYKTDMDGKLRVLPKADIKALIGRSPDYSDAIMMRMYFLLNPTVKKYRIR